MKYYRVFLKARTYAGDRIVVNFSCNDLIEALSEKNELSRMETWYYGLALKYLFRLNDKTKDRETVEADVIKAINCLRELEAEILKRKE